MKPSRVELEKPRKPGKKAVARAKTRLARGAGKPNRPKGPFAFVRVHPIKTLADLGRIENHAKRLDDKGRHNPALTHLNVASCAYNPTDPLGVVQSFKNFKTQTGAVEGQGAIALHLIVGISLQVITEHGDPHDPDNPKNRQFLAEAKRWAASVFGEGATIHDRFDFDEAGAGVIDIVVCPTEVQKGGRGRQPKLTISTRSALMSYQRKLVDENVGYVAQQGSKRSYSALQDGWAHHAAQTLHPDITRGVAKEISGATHVTADVFKRIAIAEKRRLKDAQDKLDATILATAAAQQAAEAERAEAMAALAAAQTDRTTATGDREAAAAARRSASRDRVDAEIARVDMLRRLDEATETRDAADRERASAWAEIEEVRRQVDDNWDAAERRMEEARQAREKADARLNAAADAEKELSARRAALDVQEAKQIERETHRDFDQKIVIESVAYDELIYDAQKQGLEFADYTETHVRESVTKSLIRQGSWLELVATAFAKTWGALRAFTATLTEDAEASIIGDARNRLGL